MYVVIDEAHHFQDTISDLHSNSLDIDQLVSSHTSLQSLAGTLDLTSEAQYSLSTLLSVLKQLMVIGE